MKPFFRIIFYLPGNRLLVEIIFSCETQACFRNGCNLFSLRQNRIPFTRNKKNPEKKGGERFSSMRLLREEIQTSLAAAWNEQDRNPFLKNLFDILHHAPSTSQGWISIGKEPQNSSCLREELQWQRPSVIPSWKFSKDSSNYTLWVKQGIPLGGEGGSDPPPPRSRASPGEGLGLVDMGESAGHAVYPFLNTKPLKLRGISVKLQTYFLF